MIIIIAVQHSVPTTTNDVRFCSGHESGGGTSNYYCRAHTRVRMRMADKNTIKVSSENAEM